jgi:tRNA-2-methylthio-N6-dimethylallyladenosine synthase
MKYHIWTEGCQMNVADSHRIASALEQLGYQHTARPEEADVIVLNTCVVRQSAEDRAYGRLSSLRPLKKSNPGLVINVMGCMVGYKGNDLLKKRFPYVDVFSPPSDPGPLLAFLTQNEGQTFSKAETARRNAMMDEDRVSTNNPDKKLICDYIPVVYGCSHACTYCIIPYRRGAEHSRPAGEILADAQALVDHGARDITLLGQIVDRYGIDSNDGQNLAGLLHKLHDIDGIYRLRFLTSHPNYMADELLEAVAALPKICRHVEVPCQAGDDQVLTKMKRGYTADDYRRLIEKIRTRIPGVSIATDIIVGFPGETDEQFKNTYNLLAELKLDVAHLARYSPRPGTVSARRMIDDVPEEEKWRRFRMLEELQEGIATEINAQLLGKTLFVLFEEKVRGRWRGRTETMRLVFVESDQDLTGKLLPVQITWTGPWSLQGRLAQASP